MSEKEQIVLEAMKKVGKPTRPADIAKMIDLDGKEVSQIIRGLKKKGEITSPKRCFYAPTGK